MKSICVGVDLLDDLEVSGEIRAQRSARDKRAGFMFCDIDQYFVTYVNFCKCAMKINLWFFVCANVTECAMSIIPELV